MPQRWPFVAVSFWEKQKHFIWNTIACTVWMFYVSIVGGAGSTSGGHIGGVDVGTHQSVCLGISVPSNHLLLLLKSSFLFQPLPLLIKHLTASNRRRTKALLGCEVWHAKQHLEEICCSRESFASMMRPSGGFFFCFHLSILGFMKFKFSLHPVRAELNAVSRFHSRSHVCFTIYFMASVREGTVNHQMEIAHYLLHCVEKGSMKRAELGSRMACFKSKFQMCAQDGHL